MSNSKHGYLPLGQEDTDHSDSNHNNGESSTNNNGANPSTHRPELPQEHVAVTMSQEDSTTDKCTKSSTVITTQPGPLSMDSYIYPGRSFVGDKDSTSVAAVNKNASTTSNATTIASSGLRPLAQSIASAPAAPTMTAVDATPSTPADATSSSSTAFQFPRFGAKHKSLVGLKDRLSSTTSAPVTGGESGNSALDSTYARLVGSKSLRVGLLGNSNTDNNSSLSVSTSDLLHIRPKQHPYTTEDGPRGIQKSQRRQVLREIRPDPHNLPEELLREQARSGATFDAIANSQPIGDGMGLPTSPASHPQGSGSGTGSTSAAGSSNQGERGTLLGSGDGLGLGFGVGGKANAIPSRWGRSRLGGSRRRHRRASGLGMGRENDQRVIQSSVFKPVETSVDGDKPVEPAPALTPDHGEPMTSTRFVAIVDSVKEAIHNGIQPLRIAQGSSGSYFCRNTDGKIVGVFKPKNEEPYGQLNPKWAKWIHRNLFPCCFGRSCLIPNLGYISESATSLVDRRLNLNIVPSTEVVWLSSPAFHYDYLDRRAAQLHRGAKPLPDKVGSFQLFLNGFKDANLFMRDHPWPLETPVSDASGKGKTWRRSTQDSIHSHQESDGASLNGGTTGSTYSGYGHNSDKPGFSWTPALQQQFREQFEKMIILDYLIRNTDRGLDNWMIRYCEKEGISIVTAPAGGTQKSHLQQEPVRRNSRVGDLLGLYSDRGSVRSNSSLREGSSSRNGMLATPPGTPPRSNLSRVVSSMGHSHDQDTATERTGLLSHERSGSPTKRSSVEEEGETSGATATTKDTKLSPAETIEAYYGPNHVHVAAIDNGLAFPFKHPDSWRSYPYGWLFLPRPLISQPFTKATRDHFLPLLSSPVWWRETIADLRRLFSIDSDFDQGMFDKQMAVMKGQGWNIVETLKNLDHGPMDLCRRVAVVVWDEEVTLEPGVSPAQLGLIPLNAGVSAHGGAESHGGQQPTIGYGSMGHSQKYTTTQPKAMVMDPKAGYLNYGSMVSSVGDRVSNAKTLSTSSTAIDEGAPVFLDPEGLQTKKVPHLVIDIDENESTQSNHGGFRQVVSDGEYELEDEYDYDDEDFDDDAFSYDEEYDGFSDDLAESQGDLRAPAAHRRSRSSSSQMSDPQRTARDGMISIDMALAENGESSIGTKNHRRQQSHQSEGGRPSRRRPAPTPAQPLLPNALLLAPSQGLVHSMDPPDNVNEGELHICPKNHRRSRTEHDDKVGTIRFENVVSPSDVADTLENTRLRLSKISAQEIISSSRTGREAIDEPERGRGFFARGYGAISGSGEGELGDRPKWADRLRRGLSFDGHLEGFGLGKAARRERKLRKQRQRERELRERRVILVERIEPVTKNLPYFSWW
ncbi:phosphatidyl inositol kinase [Linnemannia zychae]|nr:phosphatidyl inositol kinase [Linnemannia zychae]